MCHPDAVLCRVGFPCLTGEDFNVSKSLSGTEQNEQPFAAATIEIENAAWLNMILESQQRKDELVRLLAQVAAMRSAAETVQAQYQAEYIRQNKTIIDERATAQRRLNQLIVLARTVSPILRQFLLMKGALPKSSLLPCGDENERNAKEMLAVLGEFVKM